MGNKQTAHLYLKNQNNHQYDWISPNIEQKVINQIDRAEIIPWNTTKGRAFVVVGIKLNVKLKIIKMVNNSLNAIDLAEKGQENSFFTAL